MRTTLVTRGLGYIGSYTCVALALAGDRIVIVDNLSNAKRLVLDRIHELAPGAQIDFERADLRDAHALETAFAGRAIDAVAHFAGLNAVGEPVERPLLYYENNISGTIALPEAMARYGVRRIVFGSSATVYGDPERLPLTEDHRLDSRSPYGATKQVIERILEDCAGADPRFRHEALRYFNPVGAHPSDRMGEDPRGVPKDLMPYVAQVAVERLPRLRVFGSDYATPDGTGVRDYIHVMDLAEGHLVAPRYLETRERGIAANPGVGRSYSVLEMVKTFEGASGRPVATEVDARCAGDFAACYADASPAARELGWRATRGREDMCRDARPRGHVPRCVALAGAQSCRVSAVGRGGGPAMRA